MQLIGEDADEAEEGDEREKDHEAGQKGGSNPAETRGARAVDRKSFLEAAVTKRFLNLEKREELRRGRRRNYSCARSGLKSSSASTILLATERRLSTATCA